MCNDCDQQMTWEELVHENTKFKAQIQRLRETSKEFIDQIGNCQHGRELLSGANHLQPSLADFRAALVESEK